jgi:hypothetical protein
MSPRLLRPRATGFNPKSISGLKLWLDVANTSSLTFNGSTVSQVNDLSGNGFHATQGTANNQPTYQATGFNSKPTLFIDSTDTLLSSAALSDIIYTPSTSPAFALVMACYMPTLAQGGAIILGSDSQANGRHLFISHYGGANIIFDSANPTTGRINVPEQGDAGWTSPHILTLYRSGSVMSVRRNGVEIGGRSDASGSYATATAILQIGKSDTFGLNQMYLSALLAYAAPLSISQLSAAERGLGKKWGVTVA